MDAVSGSDAAAGEARDTASLLMQVTDTTRRAFEAVCGRFGLTVAQARALLAIEDAAPMRSLAGTLRCDASNITGIADRLERHGLAVRTAREGDRRVKLLALTDEGRRVRAALQDGVLASSPVMVALDTGEREQLRALLAKASGGTASAQPAAP